MNKFPTDDTLFCNDLPTIPLSGMKKILVSGASGYIGGRLVPELLARGYDVRVMVRKDGSILRDRWPAAEIVVAEALDRESVIQALKGIECVYYLIHSMLLGRKNFESADIKAAINFREAAELNQVKRIIYLGGLGDINTALSNHLRSRIHVAEELQNGPVPITILRAAVILGSGSSSYEILKNLVMKIPVLPSPRWARTKCQPIAIRDVIKYLVGVLELDCTRGMSYDIGGTEILSYQEMARILAEVLKKKRFFIPLPVSYTGLNAYIASFFTPVPARLIRCLLEGGKNEVVCQNDHIMKLLPFKQLTYREAVLRAMSREEQDKIYTRWSDACLPAHELPIKLKELIKPPRYTSSFSLYTSKDSTSIFKNICHIGGENGWFNSNVLWKIRGIIDRILMGVGTSRGRKSYARLRIHDVIDFWRVEDIRENEMLLLRSEMKLPGRAWLKFNIEEELQKKQIKIKAFFDTNSILGKLYWYLFLPFHRYIFKDIITQVEKRS